MYSTLSNKDKKRLKELLEMLTFVGPVIRIKNNGTVVFAKSNSFFDKLFSRIDVDFLDIVKLISNHIGQITIGQPIAIFANYQLNKLFAEFCQGGDKCEAIKALYILYLYGNVPPKIRFKAGKDKRVYELDTQLITCTTYEDGTVVEQSQPIYHQVGSRELAELMNSRGVVTQIE